MMHSKHKGGLGELQACAWLLKQGYEVFRNISQCGVSDLVAWKPGSTPIQIEVRGLAYHVAADGKSGSIVRAKATRHPDVRFLFASPQTGDCSFEPEILVGALGYTVRPPAPPPRLGCSIEGCGRKHQGRGFCAMHHDRWSRKLVDGASLTPQPEVRYVNRHLAHLAKHDG